MTQSGAACPHLKDECFTVIHKTLKTVFPKVSGMVADIPSFGSNWGFNLAAKGDSVDLTVSRVESRQFPVRGWLRVGAEGCG